MYVTFSNVVIWTLLMATLMFHYSPSASGFSKYGGSRCYATLNMLFAILSLAQYADAAEHESSGSSSHYSSPSWSGVRSDWLAFSIAFQAYCAYKLDDVSDLIDGILVELPATRLSLSTKRRMIFYGNVISLLSLACHRSALLSCALTRRPLLLRLRIR